MKCPKCGYLGFETTERCRHCGYDFSLSVPIDTASELPLRSDAEPEAPLSDFDLERIIGAPEPQPSGPAFEFTSDVARPRVAVAVATPPAEELAAQYGADTPREEAFATFDAPPAPSNSQDDGAASALPLFTGPTELDDTPMTPPPARPPLAVRRATPEVTRRRTPRTIRRDTEGFELDLEPVSASPPMAAAHTAAVTDTAMPTVAPVMRRLAAALVDVVLLGSINLAVLYLTLALTGLTLIDVFVIPPIPMLAFLLLMNGGYLVAFTAANGQTIGKMVTGVRVIGDDGGRVDIAGALLRAAGVLLSIVTVGLPYIPVIVSSDRRALHDRLAGTRVVLHA